MLSKTVSSISRSTSEMINVSVDMVRGLTWSETRDLVRFARRRLNEERLPQVASSSLVRAVPFLGALFLTLISVGITTAGYTLLYMMVPNRPVDWRDAVWGGLAAAIAFEVAKRVFAIFISQFHTYAIIYGALAALPLFLLWMHLSWMITLVGALLTAALPVVKYERWWYEPVQGGQFMDAMAILKVLYRGSKITGSALVSSPAIRAHTRIGYDEMGTLLDKM